MTAWFLRLELRDDVPDERIVEVREQLLRLLDTAGFPARASTVDASLIRAARSAP